MHYSLFCLVRVLASVRGKVSEKCRKNTQHETHKGIKTNVASVLAVEVDGALEEGDRVREVTLHLEGAHSGCTDSKKKPRQLPA
jgi:hypothetical protein